MPPKKYKVLASKILLVLLVAGVLIESILPPTINNDVINHLDKMVHFLIYGVIAYLLAYVLISDGIKLGIYKFMGIVLFVTSLGIISEVIQSRNPGRFPTINDIYADLLGACFFLAILKIQTIYQSKPTF